MKPFNSQLSIYIGQNDISGANSLIMSELGRIYVNHRPDFIALLQNSDLPAHAEFADEQLINMYFDNLHRKDLLVGSAILVNEHNKQSGFDGEMELSDKAVKDCYKTMSNFLGGIPGIPDSAGYIKERQFDWKYSEAIGATLAAGKAIGGVVKNRQNAKADMQKAILLEKARKEREEKERKAKNLRTGLIVGGVVAGVLVIGILIYKLKK